MTPEELRAEAAKLDAEGRAALTAGDADAAAKAFHDANVRRRAADKLEKLEGRPPKPARPPVLRPFTADHRVAISKAVVDPDNELAALGRALTPPLSLTGLAAAAGISVSLISQAQDGISAMPARAAQKIFELTGYPLSRWARITGETVEDRFHRRGPEDPVNDADARRGRAVAKAVADNALKKAVVNDPRWGSLRMYAGNRLLISPGSLTGYMDGTTPCPRPVAEKVREDFPGLEWTWPGGIVE